MREWCDMKYKNHPLSDCTICPRSCHVNRLEGETGYCHTGASIVLARAALHMWEEPCISGETGSGTVFFSGCSLGCVYCQNEKIAKNHIGKEVTTDRLVEIYFELKEQGAANINLVTPTHMLFSVISSIEQAKKQGFDLPFVYNCGGYEKLESIQLLNGLIDIYLTDFKYYENELAIRYSNAPNYFRYASESLKEMVRQTGEAKFNETNMMTKGVIVRHLILPGCVEDSKQVVKYLYDTYKDQIYISLMNQYTPLPHVSSYPEINRKLSEAEYDEVVDYAISLGVENGFIQEGDTSSESFIPDFDITGV